jgi:hypothetical protein
MHRALLLAAVGLVGCGPAALTVSALTTVEVATLHNDLPVDGCTWLVTLASGDHAPDAASVERIRAFTRDAFGATPARVTYRLPGTQGTVECGWGNHPTFPTIEILSLAAP